MDSKAFHNLMPKIFMDELGLEATKTYHDLYSFNSRKVKCLRVIKDLAMFLFQLPMKSIVMDIIVVDVPPKFEMLLSKYWIKILGGTLQMDLSYATLLYLGVNKGDFIEKNNLPTLSVMKTIPSTTPFSQSILI